MKRLRHLGSIEAGMFEKLMDEWEQSRISTSFNFEFEGFEYTVCPGIIITANRMSYCIEINVSFLYADDKNIKSIPFDTLNDMLIEFENMRKMTYGSISQFKFLKKYDVLPESEFNTIFIKDLIDSKYKGRTEIMPNSSMCSMAINTNELINRSRYVIDISYIDLNKNKSYSESYRFANSRLMFNFHNDMMKILAREFCEECRNILDIKKGND